MNHRDLSPDDLRCRADIHKHLGMACVACLLLAPGLAHGFREVASSLRLGASFVQGVEALMLPAWLCAAAVCFRRANTLLEEAARLRRVGVDRK